MAAGRRAPPHAEQLPGAQRYQAALARIGAQLADGGSAADPADAVLGRLEGEQRMEWLRAAIARLPRHKREAISRCRAASR